MKFAAALSMLSLLSAPVLAEDGGDAPVAKPVKAAKICRPVNNATGSRIPKRVCKTREQWQTLDGVQDLDVQSKGGAIQERFGVERSGPGGR